MLRHLRSVHLAVPALFRSVGDSSRYQWPSLILQAAHRLLGHSERPDKPSMVSQCTGDSTMPTTQMDSLVIITDDSSSGASPTTFTRRRSSAVVSEVWSGVCRAWFAEHGLQVCTCCRRASRLASLTRVTQCCAEAARHACPSAQHKSTVPLRTRS